MILGYSFLGLFLSSVGGIAPGASNLAVIKTTLQDSMAKGMRIAIGAGFGEVLLAFMALCYSNLLQQFFEMNSWVQVTFMILVLAIGVLFFFSEKLKIKVLPKKSSLKYQSKFATGFILAFLNPPVLLFWMFAISLSQKYLLPLTDMSPTIILSLFFAGVFIGKVAVLYAYAKLGKGLQKKKKTDSTKMNRLIGVVLVLLSVVQGVRFVIA